MKLVNPTPLTAVAFRQFDRDGGLDVVVSAKATFLHRQGGGLRLHREQEPFQWEDAYEGEPHASPLVRQTDLTPEKVGTDVTFLGTAQAPGCKLLAEWPVRLQLGPVDKRLNVAGPRQWLPDTEVRWPGLHAKASKRALVGWTLTEPEPTNCVPLSWAFALGGPLPTSPDHSGPVDVEQRNPLGRGLVDLKMGPDAGPCPAHQISWPDETEPDWRAPRAPAGLGPLSPWWREREQYVGTYDQAWLDERHPLLPEDFDLRFWQSSPPDQIAIPHLKGNEAYRLENLSPDFAVAEGRLPDVTLAVRTDGTPTDGWHDLALDGVHFDWREDHRVILTWRGRFPLPEAAGVTLTLARVMSERTAAPARAQPEAADVDA
ncbi:DUF2169 family type VI secretion system accessory protein [Afifella aestuarii]|uniref:DUF2169 family type VI secretion system accessory protein n=1 Tax=Afifella aestuarii TaxID=1909496 RepID=UPI000FE32CAC|nr:DUF2169 domain-containing protein [Afifella aestuarii]